MKKTLQSFLILLMTTSPVLAQGLLERLFRGKESSLFPYPGRESTTSYSCPSGTTHVGPNEGKWCPNLPGESLKLDPCDKVREEEGFYIDSKNICVHCINGYQFNKALGICN